MMNDAQVTAANAIPEKKSLLDVVLEKYEDAKKDPANLFNIRVLLCGHKSEQSIGTALEDLANESCLKADITNPFCTSNTNSISSLVIDYGERFVQYVEGFERHVFSYLSELQHLNERKDLVDNAIILFIDDDVKQRAAEGWVYIDKVPPSALGTTILEKTDEEVEHLILQDLSSILELANHGIDQRGNKRNIFADNAKLNFPKLFPLQEHLMLYMATDVFFTLKQFEEHFCRFPELTRDCEVNHPAEDPLKY